MSLAETATSLLTGIMQQSSVRSHVLSSSSTHPVLSRNQPQLFSPHTKSPRQSVSLPQSPSPSPKSVHPSSMPPHSSMMSLAATADSLLTGIMQQSSVRSHVLSSSSTHPVLSRKSPQFFTPHTRSPRQSLSPPQSPSPSPKTVHPSSTPPHSSMM